VTGESTKESETRLMGMKSLHGGNRLHEEGTRDFHLLRP